MNAMQTTQSAAKSLVQSIIHSRQFDFWMRELAPAWSPTALKARVVDIIQETHDVRTFVLAPNGHWPGHRAGQFVNVEVEVNGVRVQRCYSVSSAPGEARVKITVKRVQGGRVSSWMHDHLQRGDVLGLSKPTGEFIANTANFLPGLRPRKWLLLSGGSGVTPVMSILRDLSRHRVIDDVVFLHAARSRKDLVFERELHALALSQPGLRVLFLCDDERPVDGRLSPEKLRAAVPDILERHTMLCGPSPMMAAVSPLWQDAGLAHLLKTEQFGAATPQDMRTTRTMAEKTRVQLNLIHSQRVVATDGSGSLLDQLEAAGERPQYGCRMGVCNTCACQKQSGIVENILTGELSTEPNQTIRLCVSRAKTHIELAL